MKFKILKRILFGLLIILISFCLLMVTPRLWSVLNPEKTPVGYHFEALDFLAIRVGLEKMIDRTPDIPADIEEIKNIEYKNVDRKSLQLDMYIPQTIRKPAPLLVFIHGGGWRSGERADYLVYLVAFAKKGYMTATVSYRLLKDGPYPACAEDITDAVQWFYKHGTEYGYDPDRIALIGGSAGAHLAMLAAYEWQKPGVTNDSLFVSPNRHRIKAVVEIYGPVDLTTEYSRTHNTVTTFITHSFEEAPELYLEASPAHYLDKTDPPTMILHGTSDNLVPISQSDNLKASLDSLGIPNVYCRVPLWPHTMDVVQRVNDYSQVQMSSFFEKYLK
ncbi:MAG: alpha/beta hydrolase [Bacteroidota bacterium]|nr:alpha/beta hydrolase [Bacteroidota bacterium]